MDIDDKVAFLSELFPNQSLEFILNSLLKSDGDFDVAMNLILQDSDDAESMQYNSSPTAFDHLVNTFPSVEIESIEAFLLINEHLSDQKDLDLITREFMKHQSTLPKSPRDRNLTMKLSDFNSLLRTSNDLKKIPNQQTYLSSSSICYSHSFTFLEKEDLEDFEKLRIFSGSQVREMAVDLQKERIQNFQRAASSFRSGNLTGKSSAQYYSEEGHLLESRVSRLNRIAAEKIFLESNNDQKFKTALDLHYLTVSEASKITCAFLDHHEWKKTPTVHIITGRGNHSTSGTCKLSKSVENLLKNQKRKFSFDGIAAFTIKFK